MGQRNNKIIVISEHNYETLRKLGTITDSFDSVITQLINAADPTVLEQQQKIQQTNLPGVGIR